MTATQPLFDPLTVDLAGHLMRPLKDDGHGFETGIPVSGAEQLEGFHEADHADDAWWREVLTHRHDRDRADP